MSEAQAVYAPARANVLVLVDMVQTIQPEGRMFLPAYSPDFNPIEKFGANLKKWLRKNVARFADLTLAILCFYVLFMC